MTRAGLFAAVIVAKPTCLTTKRQEFDCNVQTTYEVSVFLWPILGIQGRPLLSSASGRLPPFAIVARDRPQLADSNGMDSSSPYGIYVPDWSS
jgi:hypothetical protein